MPLLIKTKQNMLPKQNKEFLTEDTRLWLYFIVMAAMVFTAYKLGFKAVALAIALPTFYWAMIFLPRPKAFRKNPNPYLRK